MANPQIGNITQGNTEEYEISTITITGWNFSGNKYSAKVCISGFKCSITSISPTKIVTKSPRLPAGKYDVVVINDDGGLATSENSIEFINPNTDLLPPQIASVSPSSIDEKKVSTIKINGSNIRGNKLTVKVLVNGIGILSTYVSGVSSTYLEVEAPALSAGTYDITVINDDGTTDTLKNGLTYNPVNSSTISSITSVTPNSCSENETRMVAINGSGFIGDKYPVSVMIGDESATIVSVNSSTITVIVPAKAVGDYNVIINNSDGTRTSWGNNFTYKEVTTSMPSSKPINLGNLECFKNEMSSLILETTAQINNLLNDAENNAMIAKSAALNAGANTFAFTVESANWVKLTDNTDGYNYSADITITDITATSIADVIFDINSIETCALIEVSPSIRISDSKITIYAINQPVDFAISGTCVYKISDKGTGMGRTNISIEHNIPSAANKWVNAIIGDSVMVRIPQMTWKELGIGTSDDIFPAFIVNGTPVSALWMGKYLCDATGNSIKEASTKIGLSFDEAYVLCKNLGDGWHLNTRLTNMAVALWANKHNYKPNNPSADTSVTDLNCSHNGNDSGIWNMVGYYPEWNAGIRLVQGEIQVISADGITFDNSAIITDSFSNSDRWRCINGLTGELMVPDGNGTTTNSLKILSTGVWGTTNADDRYSGLISNVTVDSSVCEKAKNMLIALGLVLPNNAIVDGDKLSLQKQDESLFYSGGTYALTSELGVFTSYVTKRDYGGDQIATRVAFCVL